MTKISQHIYDEYRSSLEQVSSIINSIKISYSDSEQRKNLGRAIAACDALEDAYDAIWEFDHRSKYDYQSSRPILYYYGILQALSIQNTALRQLHSFFTGQKFEASEKINEIRNDIVHSIDKYGKESCFISKAKGASIEQLEYGRYDLHGQFSDTCENLSDLCLSQIFNVCDHLGSYVSIPKEKIFFVIQSELSNIYIL